MFGQRQGRWTNIKTALNQRPVFTLEAAPTRLKVIQLPQDVARWYETLTQHCFNAGPESQAVANIKTALVQKSHVSSVNSRWAKIIQRWLNMNAMSGILPSSQIALLPWQLYPQQTRDNAGLMLGQRLRRWPNISPELSWRVCGLCRCRDLAGTSAGWDRWDCLTPWSYIVWIGRAIQSLKITQVPAGQHSHRYKDSCHNTSSESALPRSFNPCPAIFH